MDACPKALGMGMVLRSMSPEIIAVDELGKEEEFSLLGQMQCSGVKILGSMHAGDIEQLMRNPSLQKHGQNKEFGLIQRFVELIRLEDGTREFRVYNGKGKILWGK